MATSMEDHSAPVASTETQPTPKADLTFSEKLGLWLAGPLVAPGLTMLSPSIKARGLQRRVWTYFVKVGLILPVLTLVAVLAFAYEANRELGSVQTHAASPPTTLAAPNQPATGPNATMPPDTSAGTTSPTFEPGSGDHRGIEKNADEARTNCGPVPASQTDLLAVMTGIMRNYVAAIWGNSNCGLLAINDPARVAGLANIGGYNVRLYDIRLLDPTSGTAFDGETVNWEVNLSGIGYDVDGMGLVFSQADHPNIEQWHVYTGTLTLDDQGWHLSDYTQQQ